MHSCIERQVRGQGIIYNLETYVSLISTARKRQPFYEVEQLVHSDFKNFENVNTVKDRRPDWINANDRPTVLDIKQLRYDGIEVMYKLDHEGQWFRLPVEYTINQEKPQALYERQIPISDNKYNHLQDMKSQIPRENYPFYDNLPHERREKNLQTTLN